MSQITRRQALTAGAATILGVTAPTVAKAKLPCGLKELPIGWVFEYGLRDWKGDTSKVFLPERERPYDYGGKQMNAEEFAKRMTEGLRKIHTKHGIVVLRYYPVYAGTIHDMRRS